MTTELEYQPTTQDDAKREIEWLLADYHEEDEKNAARVKEAHAVLAWMDEHLRTLTSELSAGKVPARLVRTPALLQLTLGSNDRGPRWAHIEVKMRRNGDIEVSGERLSLDVDDKVYFTCPTREPDQFSIARFRTEVSSWLRWFAGYDDDVPPWNLYRGRDDN